MNTIDNTSKTSKCGVCGKPCVKGKRWPYELLMTCGNTECSYELRARKVRGRKYGNRGGGPGRQEFASHSAVHARARRMFRERSCDLLDDTCSGRIESALRPDFPKDLLVKDPFGGSTYYPGKNTEDAYRPLCRSHHLREGSLNAASARSSRVELAVVSDRIRNDHGDCACKICLLINDIEVIGETILKYDIDTIRQKHEQSGTT